MPKKSITNRLRIIKGVQADYFALARYHYEPRLEFPPTLVYKAVGRYPFEAHFPDPVAVIVFAQPFPDIAARNRATGNFFKQFESHAENLRLINQYVMYLARLIVDPRYLKKGIGTYLLHETLKLTEYPIIETLTPIDFTNKMYQREGFEIIYTPAPRKYVRLMRAFNSVGLNIYDTMTHQLIDSRLNALPPQQRNFIENEIGLFLRGFRNAERFKPGPTRSKFILSKVPPPQAYLIWFNPAQPEARVVLEYRKKN